MAGGVSTTTLTTVLGNYYDRKFIEWEKHLLRLQQFAQMRPLPANSGKTIYFMSYRPFATKTSYATEATSPTATGYVARQINATVAEIGDVHKMNTLLSLTKFDPALVAQVELDADQAARSIDYMMNREVCRNGIWAVRTVVAATNVRTATVKASNGSNSTSVLVVSGHQTGKWSGGVLTVVSDGNASNKTKYGYAGRILSYTSGTNDVYRLNTTSPNAAAPEAFASGDVVRIVSFRGMTQTSTNAMTTATVRMAQRDIVNNRARPFGDGYYGAVINPLTGYYLKADTTWVGAGSYSDITALWKGEIGRWFGFRFIEQTQPWRETTAGAASLTGEMYFDLFFGANAFGHTQLEGQDQIIYVHQGADKTDPLNMYSLVGWKRIMANKALVAPHIVGVITRP